MCVSLSLPLWFLSFFRQNNSNQHFYFASDDRVTPVAFHSLETQTRVPVAATR